MVESFGLAITTWRCWVVPVDRLQAAEVELLLIRRVAVYTRSSLTVSVYIGSAVLLRPAAGFEKYSNIKYEPGRRRSAGTVRCVFCIENAAIGELYATVKTNRLRKSTFFVWRTLTKATVFGMDNCCLSFLQ